MSAKLTELTLEDAMEVGRNLRASDRAEALGAFPSLQAWAEDRVSLRGLAWCLKAEGRPVFAIGVATIGDIGMLWLACCDGWERYVKHSLRVLRAITRAQVYKALAMECSADDPVAQSFAERLGFTRRGNAGHVVTYGMDLC